ncbi:hypothetical protein AC579_569 [Pseudocercospora musae]|uniref:Uncharacterized protein n=1 Tax=Pseudocercospora musae TaxID=113226 RepID=A0A139H503_9PEZI|nr:hypothetical protein AC579_569 [Pseudocercospora musae]
MGRCVTGRSYFFPAFQLTSSVLSSREEKDTKMRSTNIIMKRVCLAAFAICCLAQSNTTVTQTVKETITARIKTTRGSTYHSSTSAKSTYSTATSIAPTCTKPPMPSPDDMAYGHGVVYHPEDCTYSDAIIPNDITPPALGPPEVRCEIKWAAFKDSIDISWSEDTGVTPQMLHEKLADCGTVRDILLYDRIDSDPDDDIDWDKAAPNARWWMRASAGLGKHYCIQDSIKKAGYHGPSFTCKGLGY